MSVREREDDEMSGSQKGSGPPPLPRHPGFSPGSSFPPAWIVSSRSHESGLSGHDNIADVQCEPFTAAIWAEVIKPEKYSFPFSTGVTIAMPRSPFASWPAPHIEVDDVNSWTVAPTRKSPLRTFSTLTRADEGIPPEDELITFISTIIFARSAAFISSPSRS